MEISISRKDRAPMYRQVERQIKTMIVAGMLKGSALLPSIRELAKSSGLSIITIRRAYDDLVDEGMISAMQGKGYYVNAKEGNGSRICDASLVVELRGWAERARTAGMTKENAEDMLRVVWNDMKRKDGEF